MRASRLPRGFTLIELLVVVAIIALLISILVPALTAGKENARTTVCLSNMRQVGIIFTHYAGEFRYIPGTYWQGPINLDWSGKNNIRYTSNPNAWRHPMETSVLRPFMHSVDKIFECPTARREANAVFDYTVIIRFAGAALDLPWKMTYARNPLQVVPSQTYLPALPFLIEEDSTFYNATYDDGSWANLDQITTRHRGKANMAYLDGSALAFSTPRNGNPDREETTDLTAQMFRLEAKRVTYTVWASNTTEFGWVNKPR